MTDMELEGAMAYGAQSSAKKEKDFVRKELAELLQEGHVTIFPLAAVRHLQKLWISPLATITQTGRKPRLIYDFSWSGLNELVQAAKHKELMRFGKAMHSLMDFILAADSVLGLKYLCKVDLADAYMQIWVHAEDAPSVAFIIPKEAADEEQMVGLHMESAALFCIATETFKDRELATIYRLYQPPPHPLETSSQSIQ